MRPRGPYHVGIRLSMLFDRSGGRFCNVQQRARVNPFLSISEPNDSTNVSDSQEMCYVVSAVSLRPR